MEKKQVFNPYMPGYEYVPDGEPHVFGDRIYLYGSHDRFRGAHFCLNDYICYSADVTDLTDWRYEGVIFKKEQDPRNQNIPADTPPNQPGFGVTATDPQDLNGPGIHALWAPDVVQGLDGRYYLYYCLDFLPEIGVAVCDTPAGKYEYLGLVKHADGTPLGRKEGDLIQFDPGIFIDDDKTIYLYSGNAPIRLDRPDAYNDPKGSQVMTLCEDMLTLSSEPKHLLADIRESAGTGYEGHEFFEASSIRKINGTYYFVYSSVQSHELCYATSKRPDRDYTYGGTLVDIADIFLDGHSAEQALNCLGNTHGGIECANGQWYVFYHRQTNRTNFSRQGCAEKITIHSDGHIDQAEVTSCGLNQGPLSGHGTYPAAIACQLNKNGMAPFSHPLAMKEDYAYFTQDMKDQEPCAECAALESIQPIQYIRNILDGTTIGYKYFAFDHTKSLTLRVRGTAKGVLSISQSLDGEAIRKSELSVSTEAFPEETWKRKPQPLYTRKEYAAKILEGGEWIDLTMEVPFMDKTAPLYLTYHGKGSFDLASITLG